MADTARRPPAPFSRHEFLIAWRYLRARRAEGGVSVMTWISLIGIALGVAALIATLAVRAGFRAEFVDTILGANAHVSVYSAPRYIEAADMVVPGRLADYDALAATLAAVPGVTHTAPIIRGQVMVTAGDRSNVAEVYGLTLDNLKAIPRVADPETGFGDIDGFDGGIAIGSGLARELGVTVGDTVKLISPNGAKTPLGTSPRVNAYTVVYTFTARR